MLIRWNQNWPPQLCSALTQGASWRWLQRSWEVMWFSRNPISNSQCTARPKCCGSTLQHSGAYAAGWPFLSWWWRRSRLSRHWSNSAGTGAKHQRWRCSTTWTEKAGFAICYTKSWAASFGCCWAVLPKMPGSQGFAHSSWNDCKKVFPVLPSDPVHS